jgi:hypothetical protein
VFLVGVCCWVQEVRPPLVAGLTAPRPLVEVLVFAKIFLVASMAMTRDLCW